MEHNPYAAPRVEVVAPEATDDQQVLATRGQRFANLLLDSLGYYTLIFAVALAIAVVAAVSIERYSFVFSLGLMLLYYFPAEALFGRTPAKLLTGTRTVTEAGLPPSFRQVLGRSLARLVPFEPFSCLGDPPIGWHDSWSGTRVVRTRQGAAAGPRYTLQGTPDPARTLGL